MGHSKLKNRTETDNAVAIKIIDDHTNIILKNTK